MAKKTDKFGFSTHSLERGLERLFEYEAPYSETQMSMIEEFIIRNMEWNVFNERWTLPDFNAQLIVVDGSVVTLTVSERSINRHKKVSEYQKANSKKCSRMNRKRNDKNRYK